MSSKQKVIKASFGYIIGNYLIKGLTFLSIPLFARIMETSDYGIYNNFIAYEGILFVLIGWAIHSSYKNAKLRFDKTADNYSYESYVSDTLVLVIISAVFYFVFINIINFMFPFVLKMSVLDVNLLIIYSFSTSIIVCFNIDSGIRYEYKKFLLVAGTNALSNILISVFLMVKVFPQNRYEGRILGTVFPAFILSCIIIFSMLKRAKPQINKCELKWGLKYSLPIIPHGISQIILSQFDRIMITRMIGEYENGIYSFAANIALILTVTSQSLDTVWGPWFYEKRKSNNLYSIKKYSSIYMIVLLAFTVVLMLIAPELIWIIGSDKYTESIYSLYPILGGAYFTFLYTIPSAVEYFHERTKNIALATTFAALINVVLNYIFINLFGYVAAAYTTMFTYLIYFIFHYIIAIRIEKKNIFSYKITLLCIALLISFTFISMLMMKLTIIRWLIATVLIILTLIFEEKKVGASKVLISKLLRR